MNPAPISIHHMYRFKQMQTDDQVASALFQYITCIGSSNLKALEATFGNISIHHMYRFKCVIIVSKYPLLNYFNTSHVSVQASKEIVVQESIEFQYITCIGSSKMTITYRIAKGTFQYITCIGSSHICNRKFINSIYFNTSHVSVQALKRQNNRIHNRYFNTSHVSVQGSNILNKFAACE